jgi:hypothetical protein
MAKIRVRSQAQGSICVQEGQGPNSCVTDAVGASPVPDHHPRTGPEANDPSNQYKAVGAVFPAVRTSFLATRHAWLVSTARRSASWPFKSAAAAPNCTIAASSASEPGRWSLTNYGPSLARSRSAPARTKRRRVTSTLRWPLPAAPSSPISPASATGPPRMILSKTFASAS